MKYYLILCFVFIQFSVFAEQVLILKSKDISTYDSIITGFSIKTKAKTKILNLKKATKEELNTAMKASSMIFAIGDKALSKALEQKEKPVLFAMVLNYKKYNLDINKVTGIKIEMSTKTQLGALATIFNVKRVGIISSSEKTNAEIEKNKKIASLFGIELVTLPVEDNLNTSLEEAKDIDALWMLPDKAILNLKGYKTLSNYAVKHQKPLYVPSRGLVENGGLISLAPNYLLVGKQAARIVNKVLFSKLPMKYIPISEPDSFTLTLNYGVLKELGFLKDVSAKVLSFAASKDFVIEMVK